jgi:uncharacterized protein
MIPAVSGTALPLAHEATPGPQPILYWEGAGLKGRTTLLQAGSGSVLTGRAVAASAFLAVCLAFVFWLAIAALAEPNFPPLTGRIVDEAGLLKPEDRRQIEAELEALQAKSTDQIVVYTTRSLQGYPIEDFGYRLGRAWQIGQKGKDNGVVLIVAPNDRKVRIEVGRGLEPQLTDLMSKLIIENAILPAFRRGDFPGGIKAGVHDIRDVILGDAEAVKLRAKQAAKRSNDTAGGLALVIPLIFILIVFAMIWAQRAQMAQSTAASARRRRYGGPVVVPAPSGWGSGSGGWEGGGGGGFSGGGGDFGGGGSSGSW